MMCEQRFAASVLPANTGTSRLLPDVRRREDSRCMSCRKCVLGS